MTNVDYKTPFETCLHGTYFTDQRIGMVTELPEYKGAEDKDLFIHQLIKMYHPKTRNQLRKSVEMCRAEINNSDMAFDFLIKTHKENMEAVGAPYKTAEFDIIRTMKTGEDYKLFTSYDKKTDNPAAALLLKYFNKTVDYMVPATSAEYREINPLHILIHLAMIDAAQRGFKYWNWGGNTIEGMDGVKHFKRRFGAKELLYTYHTMQFRPLPTEATKESILKNYQYFYVLPFKNLGEFGNAST